MKVRRVIPDASRAAAAQVLGLLLLALAAAPLRADYVQTVPTATGGEVSIKISSPAMAPPRFGFAPLRVTIENSAARERTWDFAFQVGNRAQFPGVTSTTRTLTVPAGQTREAWVFVPVAEPSTAAGKVLPPGSATPGAPGGRFGAGGMRGGIGPGGMRVTITQTPVGTKITRTYGAGASAFTQEQEIDSSTGAMTTTITAPGRPPQTPNIAPPRPPGTETTFVIDETTGAVRTHQQMQSDRTAPPKIIIVRSPSPGSGAGAALISASGSLLAPIVAGGNAPPQSIAVEVAGPGINGTGRVFFNGTGGMQMRPFAVTPALDAAVRGQLSAIVRGAPNLSTVEPAQLPADWRVWSSFAALIIGADEFATLDAGRRAALRGWAGLGGRIWLVPSGPGAERSEKIGAGFITTLADPLAGDGAVGGKTSAPTPPAAVDRRTVDFWVDKIQVYGGTPGLPDRDTLVLEKTPLGEALQNRVTNNTWLGMFLLMFAVVVGPVNLFIFAPPAKRYRLFLTTPLIALAAALLLGVTIFLQDGLGGEGVRRALVVLLPGDNQAAVFQEQVTVTGFLSHRGFALADDTQLTVLSLEADQRLQQMMFNGSAEMQRQDNRASGDWFSNRGRQAQLVQRVVPTRGRIERTGTAPDGAPIVESSLGTVLHEFVLVDDSEKTWTAAEVMPGKRVTLTRGRSSAPMFTMDASRRFTEVLEAAMPRAAGHWRARGGGTDLAPLATLDSIRWQDSDVLFAGVLEGRTAEKIAEAKP